MECRPNDRSISLTFITYEESHYFSELIVAMYGVTQMIDQVN
ncbi:hypothetical protein VIBNISOn1_p0002 [Vibrio nigripulchritudo SOn1]|uniref:Transposase n=1 Tax=Vibrio nigripulchritudo SOn1 TaxID=1238450 RepID=A0AAV2W0H7_9VIBR|nr:hypothetical protein VIBNISOn1_p0002 [Vibrio nigripulchritudo SOn1]